MAELRPVELSWVPEIEDYHEAFEAEGQAKGIRRKRRVILALAALLAVVGIVARQPLIAGVGIVLLVVLPLAGGAGSGPSVRSFWERYDRFRAPTQVRVVPGDGVTVSTTDFDGHFPWDQFDGVLETERVFVLRLIGHRAAAFLVLAKRGVATPSGVPAPDGVAVLRALLVHELGPIRPTGSRAG